MRCRLCHELGPEEVERLDFALSGSRTYGLALAVLDELGIGGSERNRQRLLLTHRQHPPREDHRALTVIPATALVPAATEAGAPAGTVLEAGALGGEAVRYLRALLAAEQLGPREILAAAKLGVNSATRVLEMQSRGRGQWTQGQVDTILRLAAGLNPATGKRRTDGEREAAAQRQVEAMEAEFVEMDARPAAE